MLIYIEEDIVYGIGNVQITSMHVLPMLIYMSIYITKYKMEF